MTQADTRVDETGGSARSLRPPSVLVVLVSKDGASWLRQCLVALSRQTHSRLGVMAVDNGSKDGSADLLESALGADRVIRLGHNVGFPAAVGHALRSESAREADYLLLLHDDTVLAPEAIARMVRAAERIDGVGVVGPKVLDWEDPELLRGIGMSSDRFGYPYSPLEEGEIDQGQYDRVREVLFVSSCAMLVLKEAWDRIGPPDERFDSHHEDLDFCWRARLAGFRVLMTPEAEARHREATLRGERDLHAHRGPQIRYGRERAALASLLKNYGLLSLVWVLPLYAVQAVARMAVMAATRRFGDAYQVVAAWGWNLANLPGTITRRVRAQAVRTVPDREVRRYMAPAGDRLRRWASTARQTLLPGEEETALDDEAEPAPRVRLGLQLGRLAVEHPVAAAWVLAAILAVVAYRNLLTASPLVGGSLLGFPSSPSGLLREMASGLRHSGLGGSQAASPALGILGLASVVTFASPLLLQKVLLLVLPAVAGASCYRAVRSATGMVAPGVVAGGCYALSAATLWAVSEGRIPVLVFLAGLPWLAPKLIEAFSPGLETGPLRWAVGTGLGLAVLVSFYPGAWLAALLAFVWAALLGPKRRRVRGLSLSAGAFALAALLALPITLGAVASHGGLLGDLVGQRSFGAVARLSPGPGPGGWVVAAFLPAAALMGMLFVPRHSGRTATWAVLSAISALYLAWLAGAGYLPTVLSNPVAYIGVAAFGFSVLVGLGLASLISGVGRVAFGHRQLSAAAMAAVLGVGLFAQAAQAGNGSWAVGGPDRLPLAYPLVGQAGGSYRVLWLGAWPGGDLPPPAGAPEGRVAAGAASVSFAVGPPAGGSVLDVGRPSDGPGYDYLRRALTDILAGQTRHGGALLAPLGVRFLVAAPNDLPAAALHQLAAQLDLDRLPAGGLILFRDPTGAPLAGVVPGSGWLRAAGSDEFGSLAALPPPAEVEPLMTEGGALHGAAGSSRALVYLSQQFDGRWRLEPAAGGRPLGPERAFGWAVGFPIQASHPPFVVRFRGQVSRDVLLAFLAVLWAAALWITRRPSTVG